jgi:hypothetical protein
VSSSSNDAIAYYSFAKSVSVYPFQDFEFRGQVNRFSFPIICSFLLNLPFLLWESHSHSSVTLTEFSFSFLFLPSASYPTTHCFGKCPTIAYIR